MTSFLTRRNPTTGWKHLGELQTLRHVRNQKLCVRRDGGGVAHAVCRKTSVAGGDEAKRHRVEAKFSGKRAISKRLRGVIIENRHQPPER